MTDYATYLTARLAALGLSRNALARALGHRGASQVSRWCAGKAVPREKARAKIEAALTVRANHIERQRNIEADYRAFYAKMDPITARQTPQDAPGGPISGGEAPEEGLTDAEVARARYLAGYYKATGYEEPPKVECYVVEGG